MMSCALGPRPQLPIEGPWRQASLKSFLKNVDAGKEETGKAAVQSSQNWDISWRNSSNWCVCVYRRLWERLSDWWNSQNGSYCGVLCRKAWHAGKGWAGNPCHTEQWCMCGGDSGSSKVSRFPNTDMNDYKCDGVLSFRMYLSCLYLKYHDILMCQVTVSCLYHSNFCYQDKHTKKQSTNIQVLVYK